jgi:hypothetical protein
MAVNPVGYVSPADGGNPRITSAVAYEVISGGQLVHFSGAANSVSSGLTSFVATDIGVALGASGAKFNGVAIQDGTSGNVVGVATAGLAIVRAGGTIVNGEPVGTEGSDAVIPLAAVSGADVPAMVTQAIKIRVGRAVTDATSGGYAVVDLNR